MNILLIVFGVLLIWRIASGMKKGIVRELLSFITTLFAALAAGMVFIIFHAYHDKDFLSILLMLIGIAVLSIVYSLIKLVFFPAKVITKLPVISGVDKLFGVVVGAAETLLVFWTLCYAMLYLDLGVMKEEILLMIGENPILRMLYQYNILGLLLENVKDSFANVAFFRFS